MLTPVMSAARSPGSARTELELLRKELPDLAYDLERRGRLDAADVVMMIHARVREMTGDAPRGNSSSD
ncbi:MAG TPA: hypothetical protein VHN79_14320 [Lacunisphaera sp.]|nr:hypothetical protein [Lacunisphaera sp.]